MKRRIAAEWEPVIGVMITWPPHLPNTIVKDFASEEKVFILCESEADIKDAEEFYTKKDVNMSNVSFLCADRSSDAWWPRDWGPHPLFTEDKKFKLASAKFLYSDPNSTVEADSILYNPFDDTYYEAMESQGQHMENAGAPLTKEPLSPNEDSAIFSIAPQLGYDFIKLPVVMTGGNIMSDGRGNMMSTAVLLNENKFCDVPKEEYFKYVSENLGVDTYSILSNYEDLGIQHIDCFLKMVDEETLIVSRPPQDHPLYERYEKILTDEISKLKTCYGRPYKIFRVDLAVYEDESLTAYANSYIMNKKVYIPMYGIEQDKIALAQWQEAMPGYEIKGFLYNSADVDECEWLGVYETKTGWAGFDVIHCRTKSIWDKEMLYMSVRRLDDEVKYNENGYQVDVNIVDYSNSGLKEDCLKLYYREVGATEWKSVPLEKSPTNEVYLGSIPAMESGITIEYYATAADNSGRCETMPRVAPKGVYTVKIV